MSDAEMIDQICTGINCKDCPLREGDAGNRTYWCTEPPSEKRLVIIKSAYFHLFAAVDENELLEVLL